MKDNNNNNKYSKNYKQAKNGGESQAVEVNDNFPDTEPVLAQPLEVKVYNNNFDRALKAFRALVQKERILSLYKEKQSYEKPSQNKRRKRNEMKRKLMELDSPKRESSRNNDKPIKNNSSSE
jgi:small subunit ribosomal protein S21